MFGRHVGGFFGRSHQAMHAGNVDDAPPALAAIGRAHGRNGQTAGMKRAAQVDGQNGVPFFRGEVFHPRDVLNARVVHQNIHAPECDGGKLHHGLNFGRLAHVCAVVGHLNPQGLNVGQWGVMVTKAVEHDVGALFGQLLGNT